MVVALRKLCDEEHHVHRNAPRATMGIAGLLPLLRDIHTNTHVDQYKGRTLGVDAYVWLHKGAYGCAMDIALGKPTTKYASR